MPKSIYYLKSHKRHPVSIASFPQNPDMQGMVPKGWCPCCGSELFGQKQIFCPRCEERLKTHEYK